MYRLLGWLEHIAVEIKYGFQRMFRGYDDRVIWGVADYLCKWMPVWLEIIRKKKQGIPIEYLPRLESGEYTRKQEKYAAADFEIVLEDMIDGFEAGQRMIDMDYPDDGFIQQKYNKDKKLLNKALKLFVKDFWNLGD